MRVCVGVCVFVRLNTYCEIVQRKWNKFEDYGGVIHEESMSIVMIRFKVFIE